MTNIKLTYKLHVVIDLQLKDFETVYCYYLALKNNPDQGGGKFEELICNFMK